MLARIVFCETEVLRVLLLSGGFKLECSSRKGGATFLSLGRARAQRRKLNTPSVIHKNRNLEDLEIEIFLGQDLQDETGFWDRLT